MEFEKRERNILNDINEQIAHGNRTMEELRKKTKDIINSHLSLEREMMKNKERSNDFQKRYDEIIELENELNESLMDTQEKLLEIQSMKTKLQSSVNLSYPKYKILSDKLIRSKEIYDNYCNEEESQRENLACQIMEYERMKSEEELLNRFKKNAK